MSTTRTVTAFDQNYIYDRLFALMGTTTTGYGAILICDPVQIGDLVKANNWNKMEDDIGRCFIHQDGNPRPVSTMTVAVTGTEILFATPARIFTDLQFLEVDPVKVHPSQLEQMTVNTHRASPVEWTCTNYSSTATMLAGNGYVTSVNWSWFYPNQLYYFFNLGGQLQPEISIRQARDIERSAWQPLIDAANNVIFGKEEFLQAMDNPEKKFQFVVTGNGDLNAPTLLGIKKYVKEIPTKKYSANALIVTFMVIDSQIIGSLNFVAGFGKKGKKGKKIFSKLGKKYYYLVTKKGRYIAVQVQLETDFKTTYTLGRNGGISSQLPQTQIIANSVSAVPSPIPEFSMGVGEDSQTQTITLRNNSTLTCYVSDIVLSQYTHGTVSPRTMIIEPSRSETFTLQYHGTNAGYYRGYVDILCNVNRLTLFTEVNVGNVIPSRWYETTTTNDLMVKDFTVDHAGGNYKRFTVAFPSAGTTGFSYTSAIEGTENQFRIEFDPLGHSTGTHQTHATVTIYPLDSSLEPVVVNVPVAITTNIRYEHLGGWISAATHWNSKLGLSYDWIGGRLYLTVGIGRANPDLAQLSTDSNFSTWLEVYRIPITGSTDNLYCGDYLIKGPAALGSFFGVGLATGSIVTVENDGLGNLSIVSNTVNNYSDDADVQKILEGLANSFFYYDASVVRNSQLEDELSLTEGCLTHYFNGFDKTGKVITSFVYPN